MRTNVPVERRGLVSATSTLFCFKVLFTALPVVGAEYFVTKQGDDANSGKRRDKAFLTIQKGVDALKPGDTLTIGRGEYFEAVQRGDLGNDSATTLIRAEIPGTVTLRGDVAAPEFGKVAAYRFIYAGPFDQPPKAVLERDTLSILTARANVREIEFEPGSFFYDGAAKRLYLSSSDLRPPDLHHYTIAVKGEKARGRNHKSGLHLINPRRVVIEGLAVAGYFPAYGINFSAPVSCVVRDCVTYMNVGGICMANGGSNNVVENCVSYGNRFGGILRYTGNNYVVRNCYTYRNKGGGGEYFGVMHYHAMKGPILFKNNISWGHNFNFSVKPRGQDRLENCVALGSIRNAASHLLGNLIGGGNEYDRASKAPGDNILFAREKDLDRDVEFADPLNMDFRLQSDSRFRRSGPGGRDRGPYPYEKNIFYVTPSGNDRADGLCMRTAWRTLRRAFRDREPGDTVYLEEGVYLSAQLSAGEAGKEPVWIRGRGQGLVLLKGRMHVKSSANVELERLAFGAGAAVEDSRDVAFKNCSFSGSGLAAKGTEGLRVTHGVLAECSVRLERSEGAHLSGNIFANTKNTAVELDRSDAVLYSDYNSYRDEGRCWAVGGQTRSLSAVRAQHDQYSLVIAPELSSREGAAIVENAHLFKGRGPHATALGIYHENDPQASVLRLVGPLLHSVTDTTANIEWWTSSQADYELAWGETPAMEHAFTTRQCRGRFSTYSLTGLKPRTTYYFKIVSARPSTGEGAGSLPALEPEEAEISFRTAPRPGTAATYHVSPDGSDENDGRSRRKAFRTVGRAAEVVRPADTVLVGEGTYAETVRIRATGEEGRPITFRSAPNEKVTFNGTDLRGAFKVMGKKGINLDGFYLIHFGSSGSVFTLWKSDQVRITRCFNVKGNGYADFVKAVFCADLLVKNCVAAGGMGMVDLHVCPGFHVEHNLLIRPYITALNFVNEPQQKGYFRKNIVTDNLPYKVHAPLVTVGRFKSLVEQDNCYWVRLPLGERKTFFFYGTAAYGRYAPDYGVKTTFDSPPVFVDHPDGTENNPQLTLKEYQDMIGDTGSYVGDPKCAGTLGMKPGGTLWTGDPSQMFDKLLGKERLDFADTFVTDPKAKEKGIGPVPEDFEDFWFNKR